MKRSSRLATKALNRGVSSRSYEMAFKRRFAPDGSSGSPGLLQGLLVRSGALPAPPAVEPAPPAKKRGRPRKADVAAIAAQVWSDVTDGAGVVLVDGKDVDSKPAD